jgi:hypothetical protein
MIETTKPIYYKTGIAIVRDAIISDVFELARNMRSADVSEIWKSHHRTPESALLDGFSKSVLCFTIERNESPIAMFGIVPRTILGSTASIWFLASPELDKIKRTFIKHSHKFINLMLSYYPILENYVDVENRESIKWLKWCKAEFSLVIPYGIEQQPFRYFRFRRKNV